ncbi:hypothetical protein H4582DRAFT_2127114 [Lactarius indigo]|nr:hypothetical protein H4582DRAFT_2127114 [Lactarius indigo]
MSKMHCCIVTRCYSKDLTGLDGSGALSIEVFWTIIMPELCLHGSIGPDRCQNSSVDPNNSEDATHHRAPSALLRRGRSLGSEARNYWIIIFPDLTSIGGLACVVVVIHLMLGINPSSPINPPSLVPLGLVGFILPLCTNVFVMALVAARIWLLSPRKVRDLRGVYFPEGAVRTAIDIIIESGALYLIVQLVFVVLFAIRHPAQGIVGVIAVQMYGTAPALVIIHVALRLSNTPPEGLALEPRPGLNLLRLKCALGTARRRSLMQDLHWYGAS